jgi:hypothetical protein
MLTFFILNAQGPPMPPPEASDDKAASAANPTSGPARARTGRGRSPERDDGKGGALSGGAEDLDESSELSASDEDPWISWFTSLR